ncbi:MAG: sigma-70 family RNA polymerase sigma factor [Candidatus Latescibacteria bacterium]|nr:sigma-70 family RNA polymerase sigma factor [Candidatus Latescibacterota bacterium]
MARIVERDGSALGLLYDRYARILYSVALRITGDTAEAEDTLQEVFLQVWTHPDLFDPEHGNLSRWLIAMSRNRSIDRLRARQAREHRHVRAGEEEDVWVLPSSPIDPFEALQTEERHTLITKALQALSTEQRRAIEMAYFEGLTQSEIAEKLGIPLGTIKTRIRLGMIKLRDMLSAADESLFLSKTNGT